LAFYGSDVVQLIMYVRVTLAELHHGTPEEILPWLTKISVNFVNAAHKQINLCAAICKSQILAICILAE